MIELLAPQRHRKLNKSDIKKRQARFDAYAHADTISQREAIGYKPRIEQHADDRSWYLLCFTRADISWPKGVLVADRAHRRTIDSGLRTKRVFEMRLSLVKVQLMNWP